MTEPPDNTNQGNLRHRAEDALRKSDADVEQMPPKDLQALVHELQVHQDELKIQNEELRNTQLQLQGSRDRYTELYEFAPVGYLTLNADTVIQTANLTAITLFGLDRSTLVGSKLAIHVFAEDQDIFQHSFQQLRRSNEHQTFEVRIQSASQAVWTHVEAHLRESKPDELLVTLSNINRRKAAEEELREINQTLEKRAVERSVQLSRDKQISHMLIESNVDGIITIDERGTIESLNPGAEQIFGYHRDELLGQNVSKLMPSPLRDIQDGYLASYIETGQRKIIGIGHEVEGKRKDGSTFPIDLVVTEVQLADGRVFIGTVRDITARKEAEDTATAVGGIIEDSLNEIFIIDADTLKFVQVNRGARENLGYSMIELREMTPVDIKPAHTDESFADIIEPLTSGDKPSIVFYTHHLRKDATTYDVEVHLQMAKFQGNSCFVAIILDITERKESERALARLNEELEQRVEERTRELEDAQEQLVRKERLASLGQLAGGVAHEIRNPLGVIKNGVYYLQQIQTDGDEDATDALQEINRGLHNSERIVSELLEFARGPQTEQTIFSMNQALDAALMMVKVPSNVSVSRPDPSEIHVSADRDQVERLLANLIQNGVQAMSEGGTLALRCNLIDGAVFTEVSDTGKGIAEDELEKIFEPLFTTRAKGIGLGLPLCRRYAQQNGGRVEVESKLGAGSTFTLILPSPAEKTQLS